MITKEALKSIHTKNYNRDIITTDKLNQHGLDTQDIEKLISEGVFEKIGPDTYGLLSTQSIYNYGKYLIRKEEYTKAFHIFSQLEAETPDNIEIYEYLLYINIKKRNSNKIYQILEKINNLNQSKETNLYNLFLYLSTYVFGAVPKSYTKILKDLELKDLIIDKDKTNPLYETKEYNLEEVIELLGNIEESDKLSPNQKLILSELINECKEKYLNLNKDLLRYTKEEKYQKIVSILEYRDKQINMDIYHQNILILTKRILEVLRTNRIPKHKTTHNVIDKLSWRIRHGHFKRALKLKRQMINPSEELDAEYILLVKINELILSIKKDCRIVDFEKIKTGNIDIDEILKNLYLDDHETAIILIKEYLKDINKEEYEYLILKLIKISFYKGDRTYTKVSITLLELTNNEYDYNITPYLQSFYNNINTNNFELATLYLDIIKNYSKDLPDIITSLEFDLNSRKDNYDKEIEVIKNYLLNQVIKMKINHETIMILEPLPHLTRKTIYKEIKKIPELRGFGIGNEPKRIVLRYLNTKNNEKPYKTYTTLIERCQKAFSIGNYESCIIIGRQLLEEPSYSGYSPDIYQYIGLSYSYLNNQEEAIKYLTIAASLKEELEIKKQQKNKSQKVEIIEEIEFDENLDDNFGITQIEEIAYYIQQEKMPLETACKTLNLTEEQIHLVKLIYARDYYIESMYQLGDKLLQEVEKSKNKTKKVKNLLQEIRTNKLFYKNRDSIKTRKRIITNN